MARLDKPIVSSYRSHTPSPHREAPEWQKNAIHRDIADKKAPAVVDDLPIEYQQHYKAELPDNTKFAWLIQECAVDADSAIALNLQALVTDVDGNRTVYPGQVVLIQRNTAPAKLQAFIALPGGLLQPVAGTEVTVMDGWVLLIRQPLSELMPLSLKHRLVQGISMALLVIDSVEDVVIKRKAQKLLEQMQAVCTGFDLNHIRTDRDRKKYIRSEYEKWSQQVSHRLKIDCGEHFSDLITKVLEEDGVIPEFDETKMFKQSLTTLQHEVSSLHAAVFESPATEDASVTKALRSVIHKLLAKLDAHETLVKNSAGLQEQLRRIAPPTTSVTGRPEAAMARNLNVTTLKNIGKLLSG